MSVKNLEMPAGLGEPEPRRRLETLAAAAASLPAGPRSGNVNNHIHTRYSFSPYTPSQAVWMARRSGLDTAGIMDHDSVAGAEEFLQAGSLLGLAATVGFECRCSMEDTPFHGRRLNNPDELSVAYLAMHGVPRRSLERAEAFLAPCRQKREERNRAMVGRINGLSALRAAGIALDYDRQVRPISCAGEGGSVTERHLLYALALALEEGLGRGGALLQFLKGPLGLKVSGPVEERLDNPHTPHYLYHLLGALKSGLVAQFYLPAMGECRPVEEFIALAGELEAVPAYAYLGDVGSSSVTGDKAAQAFEDAYLDELLPWLARVGFRAVTYMPSRNTPAQLERLMALCEQNGLFQISGEDINTPFQPFVCQAMRGPAFAHLERAAWALIGHERAAARPGGGMFSPGAIADFPSLDARVEHFAALAESNHQ